MIAKSSKHEKLTTASVGDFGRQWTRYRKTEGFYASKELLKDIIAPFLEPEDIANTKVAEIGSGQGRIVNMLLDAGADKVCAVEPSAAMETLKENTASRSERIEYVHGPGEEIPKSDFDYVLSIGVLHHIPDPGPVVQAACRSLKPGGKMLIWLYGFEGTALYRSIFIPMRAVTKRLPHWMLATLCFLLWVPANLYSFLCKFIPLPLRAYVRRVYSRFSLDVRYVVIYDQLNPTYAKYYREEEARSLLESAGFTNVQLHHRHGYSWTAVGIKPH